MIKKNADIMNEYFVNVTKKLDIPEFKIEQLHINTNIVCTTHKFIQYIGYRKRVPI